VNLWDPEDRVGQVYLWCLALFVGALLAWLAGWELLSWLFR